MQRADIATPARGAYASLDELISLRFPARQLKLARRNRALSALTGPNKSNFRGRGIDFEEVRSYQPGDDIRSIDWRVTARTGGAHTKLFREERERPVLLVVDQRPGMFFGSSHCFKSVLAAHLTSLLCWSALDSGDRVGGLVFDGKHHREVRPRRSRRTVLALLSQLESFNHALPVETAPDTDSFADMLANLRRIAKPGSNIYLISDFQGADRESAHKHLFQLAQHTQVTALACTDPLEATLPRGGRYAVTDGQQRSELNTGSRLLRKEYSDSFNSAQQQLQQNMARLGIPVLQASTAEPPFSLLQTYYGDRR
ncbi:conserved hypothetical protein [marine gamma proteobacterium HTCC2148]|jgi:uncharacterized protein (DUF58 family)|nr:conserved hypothetical protein [marine gamma proteobacterium HTCC2148]MBT3410233.1 DUF58 domain-containing protein [Halieaceae bacterium]MBT5007295.1 DUF58 domain-containing protein [Halieaceae bacterium]MBT6124016.1 DUF58 domain-containing protein [Halieaceae bacterium]MBT7720078.1 DUF58 domain-containing protein [Halieaceae bacterium]